MPPVHVQPSVVLQPVGVEPKLSKPPLTTTLPWPSTDNAVSVAAARGIQDIFLTRIPPRRVDVLSLDERDDEAETEGRNRAGQPPRVPAQW